MIEAVHLSSPLPLVQKGPAFVCVQVARGARVGEQHEFADVTALHAPIESSGAVAGKEELSAIRTERGSAGLSPEFDQHLADDDAPRPYRLRGRHDTGHDYRAALNVGGPIDVAVIRPGRTVEWVGRKTLHA
jgi:hypothetical protein